MDEELFDDFEYESWFYEKEYRESLESLDSYDYEEEYFLFDDELF